MDGGKVGNYLLVQLPSDFGHIKPENACFGYLLCSFSGMFYPLTFGPETIFTVRLTTAILS